MFFIQEFIYLCNMKNFLFILTLLFGMLLFVPEDVQNNDTTLDLQVQKEAVMIEKGTADMQHNLEILSSDLKGCNCLTPRRSHPECQQYFKHTITEDRRKGNPVFSLERNQSSPESIRRGNNMSDH